MNKAGALTFLGLVRRAGRLEAGMDGSLEAINGSKAFLVLTSADISANSLKKIAAPAKELGVEIIGLEATSSEMGRAVGRSDTAVVAVCDKGFAVALKNKLGKE